MGGPIVKRVPHVHHPTAFLRWHVPSCIVSAKIPQLLPDKLVQNTRRRMALALMISHCSHVRQACCKILHPTHVSVVCLFIREGKWGMGV